MNERKDSAQGSDSESDEYSQLIIAETTCMSSSSAGHVSSCWRRGIKDSCSSTFSRTTSRSSPSRSAAISSSSGSQQVRLKRKRVRVGRCSALFDKRAAVADPTDCIVHITMSHLSPRNFLNDDARPWLQTPFSPNSTVAKHYFSKLIKECRAPVQYRFAGAIKGKALYADSCIAGATQIWTEIPYVAMQISSNKAHNSCCQYCFLQLNANYAQQWKDLCRRYPQSTDGLHKEMICNGNGVIDAQEQSLLEDLEITLSRYSLNKKKCGLLGPTCQCSCGDLYCSIRCQKKAYREFHRLLCPREKPHNPSMHRFFEHVANSFDESGLAAKVIARILSEYLISLDLEMARRPVDIFYKKQWGSKDRDPSHAPELLEKTYSLFRQAFEFNLRQLEHEKDWNFISVSTLCENCKNVLSFDFFVQLLGLFEMNNLSMEIDHPFYALSDILSAQRMLKAETERDGAFLRVMSILQRIGPSNGQQIYTGIQGLALFPLICTMNHSCAPNAAISYTKDMTAHVIAIRDIAQGEELCIGYIDLQHDVYVREALLWDYQFKCFCQRCVMERRDPEIRSEISQSAHRSSENRMQSKRS